MPTPFLKGLRNVTSYFPSFALLERPLEAVLVTLPMVSKSASIFLPGFFFDSFPAKSILMGLGQQAWSPSSSSVSAGPVCISRTGCLSKTCTGSGSAMDRATSVMSSVASVLLLGESSSLGLASMLSVISALTNKLSNFLVVFGLRKSDVSVCFLFLLLLVVDDLNLAISRNVASTTMPDTANRRKNFRSSRSPSSSFDPKLTSCPGTALIATAVLLAICLGASKRAESSASDVPASVNR